MNRKMQSGTSFRKLIFSVAILAFICSKHVPVSSGEVASSVIGYSGSRGDPWPTENLINASDLNALLSDSTADKPALLHIGIPALYQLGHIPTSIFVGPASDSEVRKKLKQETTDLSRNKTIVIYCGCCPWEDCPNIRPAFRTLQKLGFMDIRVLLLPKNLQEDWTAKGYPLETPDVEK